MNQPLSLLARQIAQIEQKKDECEKTMHKKQTSATMSAISGNLLQVAARAKQVHDSKAIINEYAAQIEKLRQEQQVTQNLITSLEAKKAERKKQYETDKTRLLQQYEIEIKQYNREIERLKG